MRKTSSTNFKNQHCLRKKCSLAYTLELIGGRWKAVILWRLLEDRRNYSRLKHSIDGITERMLAKQLRELIRDGLIQKKTISQKPTRTEYKLTPLGRTLKPHLVALSTWGHKNRNDKAE